MFEYTCLIYSGVAEPEVFHLYRVVQAGSEFTQFANKIQLNISASNIFGTM